MINMHHGDKIILKSLNITGIVCSKNTPCYFQSFVGDSYLCTLNYTDDIQSKGFTIKDQHILKVVDSLTGNIIYTDDISDGL